MKKEKNNARKKEIVLGIAVLCLLVFPVSVWAQLDVWTTDGLRRVSRTSRTQAIEQISLVPYWGDNTRIDLKAARNEYEPAQIVISATGAQLDGVNVVVSDLVSTSSNKIDTDNIKLYREHYVSAAASSADWGGSNSPLGAGQYPDALIPFNNPFTGGDISGVTYDATPFTVLYGENQPVWIDIYVPPDTPADIYSGTVTVSAPSHQPIIIPITLQVWDFNMPTTPHLRSSFLVWNNGYQAYYEELLRHKIMPGSTGSSPSIDYYIQNFGLNSRDTGPWSGVDISNCITPSVPSISTFTNLEAAYPASFRDSLYDYSADEADPCMPAAATWMCQWAYNMHQGSQIKNLITIPPYPELYDDGTGRSCVDIWVMLPVQIESHISEIDYVLEKGDEFWSYNTLVQDAYSPKWCLDFRIIEHRIFPWINEQYSAVGMLYWKTDNAGTEAWTSMSPFLGCVSDGFLIYPGTSALTGFDGPVASIRLKNLREGIEDYDYIQILKEMGGASYVGSFIDPVATSWSDWTRDPNVIYQSRENLAMKILELKSGGSAYCGDQTCNGLETCSSCPGDCTWQANEICCSGIIHTGNCCFDSDCTSPETCNINSHTCEQSSCQNDVDGDGYGVGSGCTGPDCDDNDIQIWNTISCNYDGFACGTYSLCVLTCQAPPAEICNNTQDDDCDGLSDCNDNDCSADPQCQTCTPQHDADSNPCDGIVSLIELVDYIDRWKAGEVTLQDVMEAIIEWKG